MPTHTPSDLRPAKGVVAVSGYGLRIAVERGHLTVTDGAGRTRRTGRFSRVSPTLRRIIVTGSSGLVTLDAMAWLCDTGVAFTQLDNDGRVLSMNAVAAINDVRVRRGQALAALSPRGLPIVRSLLSAKLTGQREVLRQLGGQAQAVSELNDAIAQLDDARSIADLRFIEARAAARYWESWQGISIRFPTREQAKVPAHWLAFDTRRSQLSASPRKASAPINALLNYLYGILEAEASSAAVRVGCDSSMGILHADKPVRASFACDLMEPVRPSVDAYVLRLLDERTFLANDFFEDTRGHCRLMPPLTTALCETAPEWARRLGPIAERIAGQFARLPLSAPQLTAKRGSLDAKHRTPLTQNNRRRTAELSSLPSEAARSDGRCRECGKSLPGRSRKFCDVCLPVQAERVVQAATTTQRLLRAVGDDRRQAPEVRAKHSVQARESHRLNAEWESQQLSLPSPTVYEREILTSLAPIPAPRISEATGLSLASVKTMKAGRMRAHPRHWENLRTLIDAFAAEAKLPPAAWSLLHDDYWEREIGPDLHKLTGDAIQGITGLSRSYSRRVLAGWHVPHKKHWPAVKALAQRA
jgi:CRISPR-associated endonuclease Cas1